MRRDGSYIYEEFMPTGGTDVKVTELAPSAIFFSSQLILSRYVKKELFTAFFLVMSKHKIIIFYTVDAYMHCCHNMQHMPQASLFFIWALRNAPW